MKALPLELKNCLIQFYAISLILQLMNIFPGPLRPEIKISGERNWCQIIVIYFSP